MIGGVKTPAPAQVRPRRATEQDVAALVHLRSLMFAAMGSDVGGQDAAWRVAAADWLREQIEMGDRLRVQLRGGDLLARLGGDEFAILLEDAGNEEAASVASNLRARLAEPFTTSAGSPAMGKITLHTSVSIGIARFPDDGPDLTSLLRKADIAMYKAKTSREGHHLYSDTDNADGAARLRTLDELQAAMTSEQLVLH